MLKLGLTISSTRASAWWPSEARFAADFANNRYMRLGNEVDAASALGFSRTSGKWASDLSGNWRWFGADTLARTDAGVSIEPAAANIVANPGLDGAVTGVLGAGGVMPTGWYVGSPLTTEIVAITTLAGLPALRVKASGTATGVFYELNTMPMTTALAPSTAYAASMLIAVHTGPAPDIQLRQATSADALVGVNSLLPAAGGSASRPSAVFTSNGIAARARLRLTHTLVVGQSYEFEFTIACPQIELGVKVTSPLTANRASDNLTINLPSGTYSLRVEHGGGGISSHAGVSGLFPLDTPLSPPVVQRIIATNT